MPVDAACQIWSTCDASSGPGGSATSQSFEPLPVHGDQTGNEFDPRRQIGLRGTPVDPDERLAPTTDTSGEVVDAASGDGRVRDELGFGHDTVTGWSVQRDGLDREHADRADDDVVDRTEMLLADLEDHSPRRRRELAEPLGGEASSRDRTILGIEPKVLDLLAVPHGEADEHSDRQHERNQDGRLQHVCI